MGHYFVDGECTRCCTEKNDTLDGVIRLSGTNRYATGFATADQLKENLGIDSSKL